MSNVFLFFGIIHKTPLFFPIILCKKTEMIQNSPFSNHFRLYIFVYFAYICIILPHFHPLRAQPAFWLCKACTFPLPPAGFLPRILRFQRNRSSGYPHRLCRSRPPSRTNSSRHRGCSGTGAFVFRVSHRSGLNQKKVHTIVDISRIQLSRCL